MMKLLSVTLMTVVALLAGAAGTTAQSDGTPCTESYQCSGGECDRSFYLCCGQAADCSDWTPCTDSYQCSGGQCDSSFSVCCGQFADCSDGTDCTDPSQCRGGECDSNFSLCCGQTADCSDGTDCTKASQCTGGECDTTWGTPGSCCGQLGMTDCSDTVPCQNASQCWDGACDPHSKSCCGDTPLCSDGTPCTDPSQCRNGVCDPYSNLCCGGADCSDGTPCTDRSQCRNRVCTAAGVCAGPTPTPVPTGTSPDGTYCTDPSQCSGGECDSSFSVCCGQTADCSDWTSCTKASQCNGGECDTTSGTPGSCCGQLGMTDCSDTVPCQNWSQCLNGACDPHSKSCCGQTPLCSDGTPCTDPSQCSNGVCDPYSNLCCGKADCSDGTPCTDPSQCSGGMCTDAGVCTKPTPTPTNTPTVTPTAVDDVVVRAPMPLSITIPKGTPEVDKTLAVTVRNAGWNAGTIQLDIDASQCPAGSVGSADFGNGQNSILVPVGKTAKATVPLTIHSGAFTGFNFKAPTRCPLVLTASPVGSGDPNPSNNQAVVELNVVDKNDPEQITKHETTIKSVAPTTLTIASGATTGTKNLAAVVGNADYRPTVEKPGDSITLQASTSCSGLTLSTPVCNARTNSATVTVKGGARHTCKFKATVDPAQISTPNRLSPQRCTATLTAIGPSYPEASPLDPSNNTTQLTIDITDKNDF